jgi:hypothetical protein
MNRNGTTNLTIDILGYHFIDTLVGTAGAQGPPGAASIVPGPPGKDGVNGLPCDPSNPACKGPKGDACLPTTPGCVGPRGDACLPTTVGCSCPPTNPACRGPQGEPGVGTPGVCSCPLTCSNACGAVLGAGLIGNAGPRPLWDTCTVTLTGPNPIEFHYVGDGTPKILSFYCGAKPAWQCPSQTVTIDKGSTYCSLSLPDPSQ